jgi:hypothetical protein
MEDLLRRVWKEAFGQWQEARRVTALWLPTYPTASWAAPAVAVGALIALVVLAGVSLLALGVLLTALLASYLIIANVLGISIEVVQH